MALCHRNAILSVKCKSIAYVWQRCSTASCVMYEYLIRLTTCFKWEDEGAKIEAYQG